LLHAPDGVQRVIGRVLRRAKSLVSNDTTTSPSASESIAATTNHSTTHRSSDRVVVHARLSGTRRVPSRQMAHPLKPAGPLHDPRRTAARPVAAAAPTALHTVQPLDAVVEAAPATMAPRRTTSLAASSLVLAHRLRDGVHVVAAHTLIAPRRHGRRTAFTLPSLPGPQLLSRIGHERAVALSVAGIVLAAASFSLAPAASGGHAGADTAGATPRIAVGGAELDASGVGSVVAEYADTEPTGDIGGTTDGTTEADLLGDAPASAQAAPRFDGVDTDDPEARAIAGEVAAVGPATVDGPFLSDGTLLKPVAVDTDVADGSDLMQTYKVKAGDTLSGIAHKFGVTMMTLYWANDLKSKDRLHQGQKLEIPPVTGLLIEVSATDTLAGLAKEYKVDEAAILAANEITDPNLVLGQVLILPGAKGDAIASPSPSATTKPATSTKHSTSKPKPAKPPRTYTGGRLKWPTTSHRLSQGFHYGHYGLDIDGDTGDPIWAAAGGTVTFAGWKNNGGGYQVWIAHGSGLYTTYNHMSSVSVSRGQHVGRGQRVGRMGATGFATGSHLHFEVWRGPIWNGGRRVNPLAYL
jgi:murein DD-endopeptidase MepM/ murein hydrolase activator NlpD